jgi:hypothetical protein
MNHPLGQTTRADHVTYMGVFDEIWGLDFVKEKYHGGLATRITWLICRVEHGACTLRDEGEVIHEGRKGSW